MTTQTDMNNALERSSRQPSAPLTPNRTKPIGSISLVPTSGESSPTSVLVDVTAETPYGISDLKRIKGYSSQLLLPEAMMYGNNLMKVWNIDDDCKVGEGSQSTLIHNYEEPTYDKNATNQKKAESANQTNEAVMTTIIQPISTMEEETNESYSIDMDDLFLAVPTSMISLSPRLSPAPLSPPSTISLPPQVFLPLSPLPISDCKRRNSGNIKSIILESTNLEEMLAPTLTTTKPSRGHRRGHRRNQSHFDFQFK